MLKKAVWWVLLTTIMAVLLMVVPASATTISELQRQQRDLRQRQDAIKRQQQADQALLNQVNSELSGLQGAADDVAQEIEELDESIIMIIASVNMIVDEIAEKVDNLIITTALYEEAKLNEETQYLGMKNRIRHIYETEDISLLQVLLTSRSLSEMMNRLEYMEKLNVYDGLQLDAYILAKETADAIREQLEYEKAELEAQQYELELEQQELERLLAEKREAYENYEVLIARARQQAASYTTNIRNHNNQIRELQSQEAGLRQREAEIRAAEEAAKRAGSGNRTYQPPSAFSGTTGERIVAYSMQFIGNPYVAGGTSLTNGADCSGFIWRIYRDFGYNVPRNSYSFRTAGTAVDGLSNAQKGDIVCYAGHVGIYIGNGRIVHASTERTGIRTSNANYRPVLGVRRLV